MFPQDAQGFAIDDQFYVGSSGLLVKPVVIEGSTEANIYIADEQVRIILFSYAPRTSLLKKKNLSSPTTTTLLTTSTSELLLEELLSKYLHHLARSQHFTEAAAFLLVEIWFVGRPFSPGRIQSLSSPHLILPVNRR